MVAPVGRSSAGSTVPRSLRGPSLQAPLRTAPIPVLITGATGVVRFANLACARLLGLDTTELTGRPVLGMVRPEDRGLFARRSAAVASGAATADLVVRVQGGRRVVPCLIGGAAAATGDPAAVVLWVMVRPGLWRADPGPTDVTDVALALSRLALSRSPDVEPLERVAQAARWCREVTGRGCEVALVVREPAGQDGQDGQDLAASTSQAASRWSRAQVDAGEGPLVAASRGHEVSRSTDLGADPRFPALAGVIPRGHTIISRPVMAAEPACGTLTVYDASPGIMAEDDVVLPSLAAATAAIASRLGGPPTGGGR